MIQRLCLTTGSGAGPSLKDHAMKILSMSLLLATTLFFCASSPLVADEQSLTVPIKRLKLETALRIAQAAIAQCRKEGVQIAVTVVDRGGDAQVVLRDVLAMDITLAVSKQKAHTAMAFNTPLSQMKDRFGGSYGVPKLDGLMVSSGGIPINIGGSIMGGIGVSGAPSGETDEKCATAGLDAVRDDLEME
jgi:uncharacterized protein GlcG (DUF336 family)